MTIPENRKHRKNIKSNQIIMLRGESNYTMIYLSNGKKLLNSYTLKLHEKQLGAEGFLRVHRAYLVNPDYLSSYDEINKSILMQNGMTADVARRRKKVLQDFMAKEAMNL